MGKLARLASVKSANKESFVYLPPDNGYKATRIMLLCNVKKIDHNVLDKVLRGLRRASPVARILLVDRICPNENVEVHFAENGVNDLLDDNMRVASVNDLIMVEYENQLAKPVAHSKIEAPGYITDYDCVISLGIFSVEFDMVFASLVHIEDILPCESKERYSPADFYFTIAHHFDGAIVELPDKVMWGDDILAVDEAGAHALGLEPGQPTYIKFIRQHIKKLSAE